MAQTITQLLNSAGYEIMLWYCQRCGKSGAFIAQPRADVFGVTNAIREAHDRVSGSCDGGIEQTRVVEPDGWLQAITDSF
jgi:hypothetical protein